LAKLTPVTRKQSAISNNPGLPKPPVNRGFVVFNENPTDLVGFISVLISPTPSISPSLTPSVTPSISPSLTPSISITPSVTPSLTPSISRTPSVTPSITPSISRTPSVTPSVTPSISRTPSLTPSITRSPSITPSITRTPSITLTPFFTPSVTPTPSGTPSITPSITVSPTISPSYVAGVTFSQAFTQSVAPTSAVETAWNTFRFALTGTYTQFTWSSTNGSSITVSDPTLVQSLANGLRTGTATAVTINSVSWRVGTGCGTPKIGGVAIEFSNIATCSATSTYALRPQINNGNWGGTNQSTVNAPSQTITLTFS
jgi:hypothetical protein